MNETQYAITDNQHGSAGHVGEGVEKMRIGEVIPTMTPEKMAHVVAASKSAMENGAKIQRVFAVDDAEVFRGLELGLSAEDSKPIFAAIADIVQAKIDGK